MTHALVNVGHIGIHGEGGRSCILRPSLRNMDSIGDSVEFATTYAYVMHDGELPPDQDEERFSRALRVIYTCADDDGLDFAMDVFGHYGEKGWIPGIEPKSAALEYARAMLRHGVTGDVEDLDKKPGGKKSKFSPRECAYDAVAHLGISEEHAWSMTMTGLVLALNSKYPDTGDTKGGAPTAEELDAAMEWFEVVDKLRRGEPNG